MRREISGTSASKRERTRRPLLVPQTLLVSFLCCLESMDPLQLDPALIVTELLNVPVSPTVPQCTGAGASLPVWISGAPPTQEPA